MTLMVGAKETEPFHRQAEDYATLPDGAWREGASGSYCRGSIT